MTMYPMILKPAVSSAIWGGRRLINEYGVETEKENAAEAWVLSCHPNGSATVVNGKHAGRTLKSVYEENKEICGKNCERFEDFPILIKFIDAMDNLSIQVHPDDEYARGKENSAGKTECWYILDCDENACLILGFNENIDAATFKKAIENDTLLEYVNKVKIKKGDFFFIESGTLHAICKGVLLVEVQQNSDITYRVYDYNRTTADGKQRELHIPKAVDVTNTIPYSFKRGGEMCKAHEIYSGKETLISSELFTVSKVKVADFYETTADESSFVSLLAIDGKGSLECLGETILLKKGGSVFIPAGAGKVKVYGDIELIETRI